MASTQSAGLEIVGKNRLFKVLDLTTTLNFFYYKLDDFKYIINNQVITGEADAIYTLVGLILWWQVEPIE